MTTGRLHELDDRVAGDIHVTLLWDAVTGRVTVAVVDAARGEEFELEVPPDVVREVYAHPFSYAAAMGVEPARVPARPAEEPVDGDCVIELEPAPVCLAVEDQERAKAFYSEVLGFRVVGETRVGGAGDRRVELRLPRTPTRRRWCW